MRKSIALSMAFLLMVMLAACGGQGQPAAKDQSTQQQPQPQTQQTGTQAGPSAFHIGTNWEARPAGHFNTFVPKAISLSAYSPLMQMPMAMYYWESGKWLPLMATSWEIKQPDQFVVKLRQGAKWSDGTEFTAQDVLTTFTIGRFYRWAVWNYLSKVEASDKHTVVFTMSIPSSVVPRYVLRENVRPASQYGEWAGKIAEVLANDPGMASEAAKNLRVQFDKYRPDGMVASGPFKIDHANMTEAQLTLVKVPTAWNADIVKLDKIVVYAGETPVITPLALAKEVDYSTHGYPVATVKQFQELGIGVRRPPTGAGRGLLFNHRVYPLNRVEVRQAIAHVIDRSENGVIALGESGVGVQYMAGFTDTLVPQWLGQADIAKLNRYEYNPKKAEELLTSIGFKRGSDGIWVDDKGKKMEFELKFETEYADVSGHTENAAQQLNKFGIKVVTRGVTYTQMPQERGESKYEMVSVNWGGGNPHPHFSYTGPMFDENFKASNGVGSGFELKVKTNVVGEVDFEQLIVDSARGLDEAEQKARVTRLALAFNEQLPYVPLFERYGNSPVLEGVRVTGWPPESDPIWKNSQYGDNPVVMLILEGRLQGK